VLRVARGLPQLQVEDVRSDHLKVERRGRGRGERKK
jgi:hypothetical protein